MEPSGALPPEASFRLYTLSTREPEILSSHVGIEAGDRPGIYDFRCFQPSPRRRHGKGELHRRPERCPGASGQLNFSEVAEIFDRRPFPSVALR